MKKINIFFLLVGFSCFSQVLCAQLSDTLIHAEQDTYVSSFYPAVNYGADTTMRVRTFLGKFGIGQYYERSFVEFDLSSIPSNAVIQSSRLIVKRFNTISGSNPFRIKRILESWDENLVDFSDSVSISALTADISSSYTQSNDTLFFDVTSMTQRMVYGSADNYGWSIQVNNEALSSLSGCYFYTSESIHKPALELIYYLPITVSSAIIKHESYDGASNGSINPTITGGTGSYTYVWTEGSSGDTIGTGSSISGLPYGWYGLNVTGAYDEEMYCAFFIGLDCDTVEIFFKPSIEYFDDAYLNNYYLHINSNLPNTERVVAHHGTSGGIWYDIKTIGKYNVWLDENQDFNSAILKLTGKTNSPSLRDNTSKFSLVTSLWSHFGVTYNNQPTLSSSDTITVPEMTSATEIKYVETEKFWNIWKLDNSENYGMVFELDTHTGNKAIQDYWGIGYTDVSKHPEITFEIYTHNPAHPVCNPDMVPYKEVTKHPGSGYASAWNNEIRFAFDEEYDRETTAYLDFHLYDDDRTPLASCNSAGSTTGGIAAIPVNFDDNRYIVDLSGVSGLVPGDFYQIEVNNTKGDTYYLRFIYKN